MNKSIAVIGAGVSGIAATKALINRGIEVTLFDQGKNLGGRLGIRTLKEDPYQGRNIDVGAAYFTISDPLFKEQVDEWISKNLVKPWVDTFKVFDGENWSSKCGPMRYVANNGLKNILFHELDQIKSKINYFQDHKVQRVNIENKILIDKKQFDGLVLALPAPQAIRLIKDETLKNELKNISFNPVLVSWFSTLEKLDFDGIFINNNKIISLLINEGSKQNNGANICTIYSTHDFAKVELEHLEVAKEKLVNEAISILNISNNLIETGIMRWTLAHPNPSRRPLLPENVAIVGDAFSDNPRIEAAWVDGSQVLDQLRAIL